MSKSESETTSESEDNNSISNKARRKLLIDIPKVELHIHLEGALRLSTIAEVCQEVNLVIPNVNKENPIADLQPYREYFCIAKGRNVENISIFFRNFMHTQSLLYSERILERVAYELCEDSYNNGVKLLEIRYSPSFILLTVNPNIDHSKMTFLSIYNAITAGIQRAQTVYDIAVGLIGIFDRTVDMNQQIPIFHHFYHECHMVHAIDLAADESYSCLPFIPFYTEDEKLLIQSQQTDETGNISVIQAIVETFSLTAPKEIAEMKSVFVPPVYDSPNLLTSTANARLSGKARFGKTCHAGESTTFETVAEAITHLNVTRIGHGFLSIQDDQLIQTLIKKSIHLEICPISNLRTGSVKSIAEHPIRALFDQGVSLSINSDDPGIFDSSIIDDYELCMVHYGFTVEEFRKCNLEALKASFLPDDVKAKIFLKYFNFNFNSE